MDILLPKWVAIELVCRIICKVDRKIKYSEFKNHEFLKKALDTYKTIEFSKQVAQYVFKERIAAKIYNKIDQVRAFHTLVNNIRHSRNIYMPQDTFDRFVKSGGIKNFTTQNIITVEKFVPIKKRRNLEGTRYRIYYYHADTIFEQLFHGGIGVGLLELGFGSAFLSYIEPETNELKKLQGTFDVDEIENGYRLFIEFNNQYKNLKTEIVKNRKTTLTFFVDLSDTLFSIGSMFIIENSLRCRNVIITKITNDIEKATILNSFTVPGEEIIPVPNNLIPLPIWRFFTTFKLRFVEIPDGITTIEEFKKFFARQSFDYRIYLSTKTIIEGSAVELALRLLLTQIKQKRETLKSASLPKNDIELEYVTTLNELHTKIGLIHNCLSYVLSHGDWDYIRLEKGFKSLFDQIYAERCTSISKYFKIDA